jgi:hypothetical protein
MGLMDYDLGCGVCLGENIGMLPVSIYKFDEAPQMMPLAFCRDCGFVFMPPEEVMEEKRREWGEAIRKALREECSLPELPEPGPEPEIDPAPSSGPPACEKCGKKMKLENTSTARDTIFRLWICRCGWQKITKTRTDHDEDSGPSKEDLREIEEEREDE